MYNKACSGIRGIALRPCDVRAVFGGYFLRSDRSFVFYFLELFLVNDIFRCITYIDNKMEENGV